MKEIIFWRGKASYLYYKYSTEKDIQGSQGKPRECSGFLEDDSNDFREILSTQENLWEGFPKVAEALASSQSQPDLSLRNLNIVFRFW